MEDQIIRTSELSKQIGAENFSFKAEYASKDNKTWYIIYFYFEGYTFNVYGYDFETCMSNAIDKAKEEKGNALQAAKKLLESESRLTEVK